MPDWSGRSKGGTLGYRFFILLIRHANIRVSYSFLRLVAFYYLLFSDKRSLRFYFREIHAYSRWQTFRNIYRNYCLLGEVLVDRVALFSGKEKVWTYDFEGEEHLHELSRAGEGAVLIGAHMGNWEMAGQLLERIETPVSIVMHEAERENISRLLEEVMVDRNIRVITQKDDYSHLFRIREALGRKEFVVLHGDRYLPGASTVDVPFMGRMASFPSGPLYLASKQGVPVSFVFSLKEGPTHYHFHATGGRKFPYPARPGTRRKELENMVSCYVDALEKILKKYPLQWFNYYPFWKEETAKKHGKED